MIALYCYLYFSIKINKEKKIRNSSAEITKKEKRQKLIRFTKVLAAFQFTPFKTPF